MQAFPAMDFYSDSCHGNKQMCTLLFSLPGEAGGFYLL